MKFIVVFSVCIAGQLNRNDFPKYIFVYKLLELSEDQEIEVLNSVFNLVQTLEFPKGKEGVIQLVILLNMLK